MLDTKLVGTETKLLAIGRIASVKAETAAATAIVVMRTSAITF